MCSSNPTTDGAPEPCSAGLAGASLVHPVEPLEQVRQIGIVDPDPGDAYQPFQEIGITFNRHALRRELDSEAHTLGRAQGGALLTHALEYEIAVRTRA